MCNVTTHLLAIYFGFNQFRKTKKKVLTPVGCERQNLILILHTKISNEIR